MRLRATILAIALLVCAAAFATVRAPEARAAVPFVDQQVQAQLLLLQGYINTTALNNGFAFPAAKTVRQGGGLNAPIWPSNPWTGKVMAPGSTRGTYTYTLKADGSYTLIGHLSVGSYKLSGGPPKWFKIERDAQTKASLALLQQYVEMWARDHAGAFPQATDLAQTGAVGQQRPGLLWPANPWTGAPLSAGNSLGAFAYAPPTASTSYVLRGHLSNGKDFVIAGSSAALLPLIVGTK